MEDDYEDKSLRALRKKQEHCVHPSLRCSLCALYQDNIQDKQRREILKLDEFLEEYEHILMLHNISFVHYEDRPEFVIIKRPPPSEHTVIQDNPVTDTA